MPTKDKALQAQFARRHYLKNKAKMLQRARVATLLAVARNKAYVLNYLQSHPCVDCKQADPVVLDFDHVRGCKRNAICRMVSQANSIRKIEAEIDKCEVRCANCHRRKTAKDRGYYRATCA